MKVCQWQLWRCPKQGKNKSVPMKRGKIECLKLHSSSFSYSLKTCYWLSFSRRLLVPSCCFRCVMAGVQPYAMPADVCSLLAEAQRNVLPQSHRARSMSSCCVKTLRARSRFSRFFFCFCFFRFFGKSWARNVNLRKWLNVRLILKVCVYIVKRHRARSDTCYRLIIFQFFFLARAGRKKHWARNETLSQ